jgi:vesicle coat complex subunit
MLAKFHRFPTILIVSHDRYASEVDVDFVRRSIKAIGQAAVKIEAGAERCVNVLLELISTRVSYVVQEAVVVMKVLLFLNTLPLLLITIFSGHFSQVPHDV